MLSGVLRKGIWKQYYSRKAEDEDCLCIRQKDRDVRRASLSPSQGDVTRCFEAVLSSFVLHRKVKNSLSPKLPSEGRLPMWFPATNPHLISRGRQIILSEPAEGKRAEDWKQQNLIERVEEKLIGMPHLWSQSVCFILYELHSVSHRL